MDFIKSRDELNTEIQIAVLAEIKKLNEVEVVVDPATRLREAYKELLGINKPKKVLNVDDTEENG